MDSPDITAHDLRVLSIGYYIQGGICAAYTLLIFGYSAFIGALLAYASKTATEQGQTPMPPALVSLFSVLFVVIGILAAAYTAALFLAAYWLRRRRHRIFILVAAGLNCMALPYGTVLGIFTFFVLGRPTAKQLFEAPILPLHPATEPPPILPA